MGIFKGNKTSGAPDTPLDQVVAMKAQGYSNNQIIQSLQRDGYTSSQIFDAISQSEMNPNTGGIPNNAGPLPPMNDMNQMGQMPPMQGGMPQMQGSPLQNTPEELIEALVDEKWNALVKDINKVIEWKQKADQKLAVMDQQVNDLKEQFDKLHGAIIGKINDYDKNILEVGSQLQAMEKVFSKVLPTFVDNVNQLSAITDKIRVEKKSTKEGK